MYGLFLHIFICIKNNHHMSGVIVAINKLEMHQIDIKKQLY